MSGCPDRRVPASFAVPYYDLAEICAEKLRSTRQTQAKLATRGWPRPRGRDYYDLLRLVRLDTGLVDWARVAEVLPRKCAHRDVTSIKRRRPVSQERLKRTARTSMERAGGKADRWTKPSSWKSSG